VIFAAAVLLIWLAPSSRTDVVFALTTTPSHTPTGTPTSTSSPTGPTTTPTPYTGPQLALDLNISNGAAPCDIIDPTVTINTGTQLDVAVCASGLPTNSVTPFAGMAAFNYRILYDDGLIDAPEVADTGGGVDDNPDANTGATTFGPTNLGPLWVCQLSGQSFPTGDTNPGTGPGLGNAFSGACGGNTSTLGASGVIGIVRFDAFVAGTSVLDLSSVELTSESAQQIGSCQPATLVAIPCGDGTVTIVGPPQPTFTPLPTQVTPTPIPTATPSNLPAGLYLDLDVANGSGPCDIIDATATIVVGGTDLAAVCQINAVAQYPPIVAFNYALIYDDLIVTVPEVADVGPGLDDNPDTNSGATTFGLTTLGPLWECSAGVGAYPKGDANPATGPGAGRAFSGACSSLAGPRPLGISGVLSMVTFSGASVGSTSMVISAASLTDNGLAQVGSCNPLQDILMTCVGGTIHVVPPPTATPSPTPTLGITVNKAPDNANLFLCEVGPCAGPGEGDVVINEVVSGVTEPLGAWEIQIKFDHKIFNVSIDPNEALFTDYGRTPNCNLQVVTENWILFGCVSTGPVGSGFTGGPATLATITLTPNEDLKFRLHPGNDNGVVRMILDENCEVANTLGHPQSGSVNGGLAAVCGDASVTARILEGDLNLDCVVDVSDQQLIASRYGTFFGNIFYDPWFDLEPALKDFDIDIKDLQKVFGRDGSTCANPIPAQPPAAGLSVGPL
jgi:hypothetical protein